MMRRLDNLRFYLIGIIFLLILGRSSAIAETLTLSLDSAIGIALAQHPNLTQGKESINQSRYQLQQTKSGYLPQLNLNSNYSRSGAENSNSKNSYSASVSASQLIYDFGKTPSLIRQSEENLKMQELTYQETVLGIILDVKAAYYNVLRAHESVLIAQESRESAQLHLKLASTSYEIGKVAKLDVVKAEVEVANAELSLVNADNAEKIAIQNLSNTMGMDAVLMDNLNLKEIEIPVLAESLTLLYGKATTQRPDVLTYQYQWEKTKASLRYYQHGHFPSISASGSVGESGNDFPLSSSWSGGVGLSISLFNGMRTEAQIKEVQSQLRALASSERKTLQDVQLDVNTNYLNVVNGNQKILAARKLQESAKESLRLATGRYENGLGSLLDLTDAQVSYTDARGALAQAIYDYQTYYAKLLKSVGEK